MATARYVPHKCPACQAQLNPDARGRCRTCGADLVGKPAQAVFRADDAIATLQGRYDALAAEWREWANYREYYAERVRETAAAPAVAPVEAPAAAPAPQASGWSEFASPAAVESTATTSTAPTSTAPTPTAPPVATAPMPTTSPEPERTRAPKASSARAAAAREALTAPAMLGVAGASLLVAAAIVFVALAWTSFSPAARGTVVLAVGVLVAGISVWVKRLGLQTSSGAIGVVAMGFAGVSAIAYFRDSGVLGSFDAAAALLIAGIAGLVLSRFGIPWVGSAAALAMAGSVASFTFAATSTADGASNASGGIGAMPVWIIAGTAAATALAATHRLWKWTVAKSVVAWASVLWLVVVGASVPFWVWFGEGGALEAALGFLPVLALSGLATRWQLLATGPAAFLFTLMTPALAAGLGASVWPQAAASAAAVTAVLAAGRWLPRRVLRPLFAGVAPAFVVVSVASAGYALSITVGRILAGTYVPDTQLWAGVTALLCGLAIATLRLWKLTWGVLRVATSVGAVMVVVGAGITAFGIAELTGSRFYHSSVAVALAIAAVGLAAMTRVWWEREARILTEVGVLAFLVTAVVHADWAVVISELALVLAVLVAASPLAVFAARARAVPWWTLPFATAAVTALAASVAARFDASAGLQAAVLTAAACAIAWTGWRLPQHLHSPVAVGLTPALAAGVACGFGSAVATVVTVVNSEVDGGRDPWWDVATLALALALAAWHRWHLPARAARALPLGGAVALIVAAAGFAGAAAGQWGIGLEGAVPLFVLVSAVAILPGILIWRESTASTVNGVGSAALATLAGLNALGYVAAPQNPVWLPLGVAVAAIVVLGVGSVRWPSFALPPAVLLATGVGLVFPLRADAAVITAFAVASAVGAVTLWMPLRARRRVLAGLGAAPALVLGAGVTLAGGLAAVLELPYHTREQTGPFLDPWTLVAQAAVAAALLAGPRVLDAWEAAGWSAPWRGSALRALRWALLVTAVAAMTSVSMVVQDLAWASVDAAAVAKTVTAAAAALALAVMYSVRPSGVFVDRLARRAARIAAVAWLALCAVDGALDASTGHLSWQAGAVSLAIALVVLGGMARRWRRAAIPAIAVLLTAIPLVLHAAGLIEEQWQLPAAVAIAGVVAWLARSRAVRRFAPPDALWLGALPAWLVALPAALTAAIVGANELVQHLYIDVSSPIEPSGGATLILLAIGLVSIPPIARFAGPTLAGALALGLVWTTEWTVVAALVAFELVALAVGARLPRGAKGAAIAGVAALGWAAHDWVLVAVAAAALATTAVVVVRRRAKHPPVLAIIAAPIAAALAAAATAYAIGGAPGEWAAAPAGTVGLIGMGALLWRTASIASRRVLPWVLSAAMIVAPVLAQSFTAAGVSLLLIGVAWFALTILGVPEGKWFASIAATFGVALIAWGADLSAIEAYTLAPALCALALGAQWMRAKPSVPSLAALGPGLAILLVPSYIALLANPDSMARTAWLTLVMVVLALVGMNRRWFAPVAATAVTAILVAVLQVVVGTNLVFRLFAFLIVGTLLLVAASWFDKIKQLR